MDRTEVPASPFFFTLWLPSWITVAVYLVRKEDAKHMDYKCVFPSQSASTISFFLFSDAPASRFGHAAGVSFVIVVVLLPRAPPSLSWVLMLLMQATMPAAIWILHLLDQEEERCFSSSSPIPSFTPCCWFILWWIRDLSIWPTAYSSLQHPVNEKSNNSICFVCLCMCVRERE